jgi:preprotein translocase subunit YajC
MAVRNFNPEEKQKLMQIIKEGSQVLGEIDDLRGGLKDTVKAIAEEMEIKPAMINKAITIAHKDNYRSIQDDADLLDSILVAVGKI